MDQIRGNDAMWLHLEAAGESMHMTLACIYEPGGLPALSAEELTTHLACRVVSAFATFRRRLKVVPFNIDHPYWVDDPDFDIAQHIRQRKVPSPGDRNALFSTMLDVHAEPMRRSSPLWDVTLVRGLNTVDGLPPHSFAVLFRFHHVMVDGQSVMEIMHLIHDSSPATPGLDVHTPIAFVAAPPSVLAMVWQAGVNAVVYPAKNVVRVASPLLSVVHRAAMTAVTAPASAFAWVAGRLVATVSGLLNGAGPTLLPAGAPRTRFNNRVNADRRIGLVEFDLDALRAMRQLAPGSTINDVALTVIGGALRCHLDTLGELPPDSLVAACPISTRQDAPGAGSLGNQASAMFVPLFTNIADPVERLKAISAATEKAKGSEYSARAKRLTDIMYNTTALGSAAAGRLALLLAHRAPAFNTIVTNVPGPKEPIYLLGRPLRAMQPVLMLIDGMGLSHVVTSANGKLMIAFVTIAGALPDPTVYEDELREVARELDERAQVNDGRADQCG
ncbi:wax ester/triacylglycerol synthase family O-acyltransferase [Mycolicibacterium llatzerense]|uniref:wax ester/triacylglycerol synthase family O-acyltransferase n=1 Tax=Mycolicibacterium llatzerense TaxID=280871 RepID=UPI0021B6D204|nr:wax ester/triacylglycerol synthase family O-acyltransferase [Mycolicibacterium llatzerense]